MGTSLKTESGISLRKLESALRRLAPQGLRCPECGQLTLRPLRYNKMFGFICRTCETVLRLIGEKS